MFAAIYLGQQNLAIPFRWICSFNPVNWVNDGMNPSAPHQIFVSRNIEENPNFNLETKPLFDGEIGCYSACIRKLFGK